VYLEAWHYDFEDFLELRRNTGDERRRTHDTNTASWIPDLFMKRVLSDQDWTLFSPDETPDLHETYGKDFERRYEAYESMAENGEINLFRKVRAVNLWRKMITMLFETGHPWITFKDPCNIRSPQDHAGRVHSSNLCTEITLNTSEDETAVCNLGSVNLARHVVDGGFDRGRLEHTVKTAMRMLDNVIDLNFYPTLEAKTANMRHRPVGLGVMGFQDALYELGLSFDSEDAVAMADELQEFISYHAIMSSSQLAAEKGRYESFDGSKWSRDIFPFDTVALLEEERGVPTGVDRRSSMDWSPVRERVRRDGMRNSNCMAIAPTATIANIAGCVPSIEPIYKNIYVKSNFSGEFTIINKHLVRELQELGLWDDDMIEKLKYHDGSVQSIREIPAKLCSKYKEVFEIDPHWIVRHAAHRGKWIDQSQSVNVFTTSKSGKHISDIYMNAWKAGLKTTYYLRSMGASSIEKATLDQKSEKFVENTRAAAIVDSSVPATQVANACAIDDPSCEACQ
jgi:ribonucleoside-diphosphate reductase alpha chain